MQMQPKKLFPFMLALAVTAGSTAVYAQSATVGGTVDGATSAVTDATGGATADATGSANTQACAAGADCADADASAQADATMESGSTMPMGDASATASGDTTLPMGDSSATASGDTTMPMGDSSATASGESTMPMGDADPAATASSDLTDEGETLVDVASVAELDTLIGARAYDANAEWVGEISAVLPADAEGNEERFVIDVGGFLGIGEKPVALTADDLRVAVDAEGDVEHVVVARTQAELEAMPEVEM
ncbi:PRC-barrel domain-containing protein [Pararhodobacter aggregans]|nr:PRC-barrel domain-containing protein [Pararhodobacter aggregans]PTW99563.1 PRC-barrel domain protein [Pararhodobacter aggregans]